jgi:hypothetical protein
MTARVTPQTVRGFNALVLENDRLRAVIIPSLGGRVWELEDRLHGRQWIWHRPDVPLQTPPVGAAYDDVWAGGWEELFPNDAPGAFEGRDLPDHGEWWAMAWTAQVTTGGSEATVKLSGTSSVVRAACTKEFRLDNDGATLSVTYRIRSAEDRPFHFLFKQHLPIAITPGCRLLLPGGQVEAVNPDFGNVLPSGEVFEWPVPLAAGEIADLRQIPSASSGLQEFVYVRNLPQGWCGIEDPQRGATLHMSFELISLPYVWLFLTYGGWRNLYTAVLEPCSNMPKQLADAVRLGQAALLMPGQEFVTTVSVTLSGTYGSRP